MGKREYAPMPTDAHSLSDARFCDVGRPCLCSLIAAAPATPAFARYTPVVGRCTAVEKREEGRARERKGNEQQLKTRRSWRVRAKCRNFQNPPRFYSPKNIWLGKISEARKMPFHIRGTFENNAYAMLAVYCASSVFSQ